MWRIMEFASGFPGLRPGNTVKNCSRGLKAFCSPRRPFWGRLMKQGVANDHTVHRAGWIGFLRPKRRKTKAHQCLNGALATGCKAPGLYGKKSKELDLAYARDSNSF
jgi:hypothetical protein